MRRCILLITVLICCAGCVTAQQSTFNGGVYGGFTTSQVNGDETDGFHRIGVTGGLFVEKSISQIFKPAFELGFSQKGSANKTHDFKLTAGYVDAALIFKCYPTKLTEFGIFVGPMLSVKAYENLTVNNLTQKSNNFTRLDTQICGGLEYAIFPQFKIDARCSYSIIQINDRYRNFVLWFSGKWNIK